MTGGQLDDGTVKPVAARGLMNGWLGVSRDGTEGR